MMEREKGTNQVRGRESARSWDKSEGKMRAGVEGFSHWLMKRERGKKTQSGTKRISEAYLYLIMTLPQLKERDTQLLYDVHRWVRCATSTDEKQHNYIL